MNLDITEKWAKEIALMSDAEFEENCNHIETLLKIRKQALRQPLVSSSGCPCDELPDGEIAISSKALQKPYGDFGQTDC